VKERFSVYRKIITLFAIASQIECLLSLHKDILGRAKAGEDLSHSGF
jgi:hypothetical protein